MKPWEKFQTQQQAPVQGKPWERFGATEQPKMSMGEAAFTTATNPLGFGDEIKAGISAGVAKLFGGAATQDIDIGDDGLRIELAVAESNIVAVGIFSCHARDSFDAASEPFR